MDVIVPDDQLSLAIGRKGQNVRLAVQLTGWRIDIKSESKMRELAQWLSEAVSIVEGCGDADAELLLQQGITSLEDLADLSIEKDGRRAYAGANGVRDALLGGESEVRSSLHLVTTQVDGGPILIISQPVPVDKNSGMSLEEASRFYLKPLNDMTRKLFPRVVKDIAEGAYRRDEKGLLYYGDTPIPKGVRL